MTHEYKTNWDRIVEVANIFTRFNTLDEEQLINLAHEQTCVPRELIAKLLDTSWPRDESIDHAVWDYINGDGGK